MRSGGGQCFMVKKTLFSYLVMTTDSYVAWGNKKDLVLKESKYFFKLKLAYKCVYTKMAGCRLDRWLLSHVIHYAFCCTRHQ